MDRFLENDLKGYACAAEQVCAAIRARSAAPADRGDALSERGRSGSNDFCRECHFAHSAGDRGGVATPGPDDEGHA